MITKYSIKNFKKYKATLLNQIDKMPEVSSGEDNNVKINKSDWYLNSSYGRTYVKTFFEMVKPFIDFISNKNKVKVVITNCWFSQYNNNDYHGWHTHPDCHFSNVFYLELPKNIPHTEIQNLNIKELNIKEGDILSFPAYLVHRSPFFKCKKRKTIIAFNTIFLPLESDS